MVGFHFSVFLLSSMSLPSVLPFLSLTIQYLYIPHSTAQCQSPVMGRLLPGCMSVACNSISTAAHLIMGVVLPQMYVWVLLTDWNYGMYVFLIP